jgi:hypothetical protein
VAQVVECLLSEHEALTSSPNIATKNENNQKQKKKGKEAVSGFWNHVCFRGGDLG